MKRSMRILVAAESAAAAEAAAALLRADFDDIVFSVEPAHHVADFDRHRAPLCVLAFATLGQAERYLRKLERSSESLHAFTHRRLVLCQRAELRRAYGLCLQGRFDDYVPFWPADSDTQRLPMLAHQAASELRRAALRSQRVKAWVGEVRGLEQLESRLLASSTEVLGYVDAALKSIQRLRAAVAQRANDLDQRIDAVQSAMDWLRHWSHLLGSHWHGELQTTRRLSALAGRARPAILAVDDDGFQHKLLRRLLGDEELELLSASTVTEAMTILQLRKVDCILMDIGLPDANGIDAVRMIRSTSSNSAVTVVMLTGARDPCSIQRSVDAGASAYIAKPFNRSMLLLQLRGVLTENDGAS
jgi:CheY-like chemotaxis protein